MQCLRGEARYTHTPHTSLRSSLLGQVRRGPRSRSSSGYRSRRNETMVMMATRRAALWHVAKLQGREDQNTGEIWKQAVYAGIGVWFTNRGVFNPLRDGPRQDGMREGSVIRSLFPEISKNSRVHDFQNLTWGGGGEYGGARRFRIHSKTQVRRVFSSMDS